MNLPQATKQNAKKRADSIARNRKLLDLLPDRFTAPEAKAIVSNPHQDLRVMEKQGLLRSEGERLKRVYFKVKP